MALALLDQVLDLGFRVRNQVSTSTKANVVLLPVFSTYLPCYSLALPTRGTAATIIRLIQLVL